jgi:hypothetical protein
MVNAEWRAARADYEAGMKRKAICEKYGCTYTALDNHVKREGWGKSRDTVKEQVTEKRTKIISDRIAVTEANNADIVADIKRHLLLRLKRTAEAFPDDATEVKITKKSKTTVYKLRDLTAAYKDLTGDMDTGEQAGNELLQSLLDLERGRT